MTRQGEVSPLSRSKRKGRGTSHHWLVTYEYEFDGKEYTSNKYSLTDTGPYIGRNLMTDKELRKKVQYMIDENKGPYAKGSKQKCYVNPKKPEDALLKLVKPTMLRTLIFSVQTWKLAICIAIFAIGLPLRRCGIDKST